MNCLEMLRVSEAAEKRKNEPAHTTDAHTTHGQMSQGHRDLPHIYAATWRDAAQLDRQWPTGSPCIQRCRVLNQ